MLIGINFDETEAQEIESNNLAEIADNNIYNLEGNYSNLIKNLRRELKMYLKKI